MFDIKLIRENAEGVRERLKNRRSPVDFDALLAADARRRAAVTAVALAWGLAWWPQASRTVASDRPVGSASPARRSSPIPDGAS